MKTLLVAGLLSLSFTVNAQQNTSKLQFDKSKPVYEVLASCGTCQFKMKVPGCPLAIKMDGKYYLVEGAKIDDFGDAHADDGFCNAIKKARVQGDTSGSVFTLTYFELTRQKQGSNKPSKN